MAALIARGISKTSERKKRDAELKALQAQISPHFLFNTLSTIRWAAINGHNKKAADMVLLLSNLLRQTIVKDDEYITLEEEFSNLRHYAELFQLRQSVEFTFEENLPDELKSYRVPKLLLQPLVENAIIHGFENLANGGVIHVSGEIHSDGVSLRITDNGAGMDTNSLKNKAKAKDFTFSGIGTANVDERIKLNFGKRYGLHIKSSPGCGTTAEILLPKGSARLD
jgi:two-component system sensor histidine kinase YesM